MNDKEQRAHKSVTANLDKRLGVTETLIEELDKRQVELTRAVHNDIVRLMETGENSFFTERQDREREINELRQQVADIQAWRSRTFGQRTRDFFRSLNPWYTPNSAR